MKATDRVAGRYVLVEPLGRGGMGAVWRARDEVLKRDIALKEVQVPESLVGDEGPDMNERVLREARAAARLAHPSATTVYDVFQENGRTFIAMELVDAPTLAAIVHEDGPLEPDEVANIGLSLLDALDAAHANGIVHRDVKPDNVMVTDTGRVKLTDFGIASVKGDPRLTMSGIILGSPSYMAPEQADGKGAGKEADLWALGATLFFAVEGRPPYKKDSPIATLASVVGDPTPQPTRAGQLGPVIARLLAKDPARRPSSQSLRRDLERVAHGSHSAASAAVAEPQPSAWEPPRPPVRRRNRGVALLVACASVAVVGVVAFAIVQGDDDTAGRNEDGERRQQDGDAQEDDRAVAPQGWTEYQLADTGYQISYPDDWDVFEDPPQVTFSDPKSSTSMLVEYTLEPGDDAVAAWEAQAQEFARTHEGYSGITIEPTTIEGWDTAAIWEFTYSDGGETLHAVDIGMANDDIGFALFFQTRADQWEDKQEQLQQFRDSFAPIE